MWWYPIRVPNTDPEFLAASAARARARAARAAAAKRGLTKEASDPATRISRLAELLLLRPNNVLANPAWELASIADPQLLNGIAWNCAQAIATHPKADAAALMCLARRVAARTEQGYRRTSGETVAWRVACRADATVEVLRALVHGEDTERMSSVFLEVARQRIRCHEAGDREMLGGWRHAVLPTLVNCIGPGTRRLQRCTDMHLLLTALRERPSRIAHPLVQAVVVCSASPARDAALRVVRDAGADHDDALLTAVAVRVQDESRESPSERALTMEWKKCVSTWEGNFASDGLSTRCAPRSFTEGMGRQMRSYQLRDWVRSWRTKEAARRAAEAAPRRRKRRPAEPAPSPWSPGGVDDLRHIPYLAFHARDRPLLTRRSRDPRWWVRAATLLNPRLSAGPRERLRHDHHWLVRAMAREEGPRAHPAPGA